MALPNAYALGQLADGLLQKRPRLLAIFSLPLGIEAGGAQLLTEGSRIWLVEHQALLRQIVLDAGVQRLGVSAFLDRGRVNVLGDDGSDVLRQRLPGPAVHQE